MEAERKLLNNKAPLAKPQLNPRSSQAFFAVTGLNLDRMVTIPVNLTKAVILTVFNYTHPHPATLSFVTL
jgi:hypothetical protein